VRRRSKFEGIQKKPEFIAYFLLFKAQGGKDGGLDILFVDADAAAADFGTVQDEIIGPGSDPARIALQVHVIFQNRSGEGMMGGGEPLFRVAVLHEREFGYPGEGKGLGVDEIELPSQMEAEIA